MLLFGLEFAHSLLTGTGLSSSSCFNSLAHFVPWRCQNHTSALSTVILKMGLWPRWRGFQTFPGHSSRQQKRQDASSCSTIGQSTYGFFHNRAYQSCKHDIQLAQKHIWNSLVSTAVVVGKYLWIHGGEFATWNCMGSGSGNVSGHPSMSIKG